LVDLKVVGDKATGKLKWSGRSEPIEFVKEAGAWKMVFPGKL
jgi:hypothetical protein